MSYLNQQTKASLDAFVAVNKENMLADLCTLARIPSVAGDAEPDAPFGKECAEALEAAAALFEREGFSVKRMPKDGYAVAYYGDGSEDIGIFGHSDVVPADGEWLFTKPFEPRLLEGLLFGRGTDDDKSGIILTLYAAKYMKEHGILPKRRLAMVIGSAEETGMADIEAFVKNERTPHFSLVPDSAFPFGYGEKGIFRGYITHKNAFEADIELFGGSCFNAVLGEAKALIRHLPDAFGSLAEKAAGLENIAVERTEDGAIVTATGITAHAAMPQGSLNAGKVLLGFLRSCGCFSEHDNAVFADLEAVLSVHDGSCFGIASEDPVFGALTCVTGMLSTENRRVKASLDIRFGSSVDADAMVKQLQTAANPHFLLETFEISAGYLRDKNGPAAEALLNAYRTVTGQTAAEPFVMSGGTYAKHFPLAFPIGTSVFPHGSTLSVPKGHGGAHQPDEFLPVDGFLRALPVLVCMILDADEAI